jgi:hypothetical protein
VSHLITFADDQAFHIYADPAEPDHVFVDLPGVSFRAGRDGVTLRLPRDVWDRLIEAAVRMRAEGVGG